MIICLRRFYIFAIEIVRKKASEDSLTRGRDEIKDDVCCSMAEEQRPEHKQQIAPKN